MSQQLVLYARLLNRGAGFLAGVSVVSLVLITLTDVALRYLFHSGSVAVQELEWHLFALIFLLGGGYALQEGAHVKIDVIFNKLSERKQIAITLLGHGLFLFPFCALLIWTSLPFVEAAYTSPMEHSPDPGGLRYRFILKAAIPLGATLLAIAGLADFLEKISALFRNDQSR